MVRQFGIEFTESAGKHGFTIHDVFYAVENATKTRLFEKDGATYAKLTGPYHGDPLVPSIEIMLKQTRGGKLTVFHVNAEQDGFWDKD